MLKIKNYVKAESLEQAYELNQKRTACVLGGMVWLKMGNRVVTTAIDLSGLGLDTITETESEFVIGCMTPLRDLELHQGLHTYTKGAIRESLRHIVVVQFRNCATVGGSIWGRFGFSDVLTMLLALDTEVELFKGGRVCLSDFVKMPKDRDILVRIIIKKTPLKVSYLSHRNTKTDFPVLACCIWVCFQPVTGKLLVKGWLAMTWSGEGISSGRRRRSPCRHGNHVFGREEDSGSGICRLCSTEGSYLWKHARQRRV